MKDKPPIEEFLHGASETTPKPPAKKRKRQASALVAVAPAPDPTANLRKNVVFRLRLADARELAVLAHEDTMKAGRRVTQQSLIDDALKAYFQSRRKP
jgi:hypothetical protein